MFTHEITHLLMLVQSVHNSAHLPPRSLWHHYYRNTDGIIFVVDSTHGGSLATEARDELHHALEHEELQHVPVLIAANKQDCEGALSCEEVSEMLSLSDIHDRPMSVIATSAISDVGLKECLDWVVSHATNVNE
eukprot:TRINITY_DN857_c1_g3_i1.p1 TRINITY_DN857_c1_g3~~TRINITY_DN857_c1_g3_i1.p1  ORF type:complete len:134 (-),score=32.88 TRINITY_DN857_c1_g3_i1:346-747(-)